MNRNAQRSRIPLIVLFAALLWPQGLVSAQNPTANTCPCSSTCCVSACPCPAPTPKPSSTLTPKPSPPCGSSVQNDELTEAGQKIKLYYLRQGSQIAQVLNAAAKPDNSILHGLIIVSPTEDEIILYGQQTARNQARRIIATLDLPRPGIVMEMWGLQISSRNPEHLAKVMINVRKEIDQTQLKVRRFYNELEVAVRGIQPNAEFQNMLQENLFYTSALSSDHPLAMADILLRLTAAKEPESALSRLRTIFRKE